MTLGGPGGVENVLMSVRVNNATSFVGGIIPHHSCQCKKWCPIGVSGRKNAPVGGVSGRNSAPRAR